MKKRTTVIAAITLLLAVTIFAIFSHQRRIDGPFLELSISHTGWRPILTFIVEDDRTFTSYYRLRPSGAYENRKEIILSEQEFQLISELLDAFLNDYYASDHWFSNFNVSVSGEWFTLKHNGFEYIENLSQVPESLLYLEEELRRLSPMRFPR